MQVKSEQLDAHLASSTACLYLVHGDEQLLAIEAADKIRARARSTGYAEREVLYVDRNFRWSTLAASTQSQSLFGDRKLIELRVPGGKPGKDGAQALMALAESADSHSFTLITMPRLDREARAANWYMALDRAGIAIEVSRVERAQLGVWISRRLILQNQRIDPVALQFMVDRVEGNLLAAHQEIQKLGLLFAPGELSLKAVQDAVLNVARYDVFAMCEAMLAGDHARLVRMIEGLNAEGEAAVLVHWAITDEIRRLARAARGIAAGRTLGAMARDLRIWGARERLYMQALKRLEARKLGLALRYAAKIDKMIKGLRVPDMSGNVWDELTRLGLMIAL